MAEAARRLQSGPPDADGIDPERLQSLMAAMLELGAARDGVWDALTVAALRTVAGEMAHRVACVAQLRRRLRSLDREQDPRACLEGVSAAPRGGVPQAIDALLREMDLTTGQRRYVASLYASDPLLRETIDEIVGMSR